MTIPDVALGATIAAVIGALVTLLGLIITKEQKTSEFRQAWVDGLRKDLTAYATQINAIADASKVEYKSNAERVKSLKDAYNALNEANFSINLRLNRDEKLSNDVIDCIADFNRLGSTEEGLSPDALRPIEVRFIKASQDLLKYEWNRVKRGEPSFVVAKLVAWTILVAGPVAIWLAASGSAKSEARELEKRVTQLETARHDPARGPPPEQVLFRNKNGRRSPWSTFSHEASANCTFVAGALNDYLATRVNQAPKVLPADFAFDKEPKEKFSCIAASKP